MEVECDFDTDYLLSLFHNQNGRCHYTGLDMLWDNYGKGKGHGSPDSMTVDRLTPAEGYVRGNIVLCTLKANMAKNDRTEDAFYAFCEQVLKVRAERQAGKPVLSAL